MVLRALFFFIPFALGVAYEHIPCEILEIVNPYLMPEDHPLKYKLDEIFSKKRVLRDVKSLISAGFEEKYPEHHTKLIVTRHASMKGYIFKIYTDDNISCYRGEPEYITWMFRARGANLLRKEIASLGYDSFFKVPKKWIYALPPYPKAHSRHLQKNFILVEEEMDILSDEEMKEKWKKGFITEQHLTMLFCIITRLGLRGGCKYDNIPICKDGKIAFVDTQKNLLWPLPYERLFKVLDENLSDHWENLIQNEALVPRIIIPKETAEQWLAQ